MTNYILSGMLLGLSAGFNTVMAGVSFLAGLVVMSLSYQGLRTKRLVVNPDPPGSDLLLKGIIVNILSPDP